MSPKPQRKMSPPHSSPEVSPLDGTSIDPPRSETEPEPVATELCARDGVERRLPLQSGFMGSMLAMSRFKSKVSFPDNLHDLCMTSHQKRRISSHVTFATKLHQIASKLDKSQTFFTSDYPYVLTKMY